MICPECSSLVYRTVFTRQVEADKVMRRKKCKACGHGWYTVEVILPPDAVVHCRAPNGMRSLRLAKDYRNILFQ